MRANMDRAEDRFMDGVRQAVTEVTAELIGKAQLDAPVDEGTLRGSGSFYIDGQFKNDTKRGSKGDPNRTGGPEVIKKPGKIRGVVGFNTEYAAKQHEWLEAKHPKGGKAKYLELNMKKIKPKVPPVVKRVMKAHGF